MWPENVSAVDVFLRCATQWRSGEPSCLAPAGVYGLDYGVVLNVISLCVEGDPKTLLEELQVMERRALELINETVRRK